MLQLLHIIFTASGVVTEVGRASDLQSGDPRARLQSALK